MNLRVLAAILMALPMTVMSCAAHATGASPLQVQIVQTGPGRIQAAFPNTIDVFDDFLLGNSSKVAMGEMPPWHE